MELLCPVLWGGCTGLGGWVTVRSAGRAGEAAVRAAPGPGGRALGQGPAGGSAVGLCSALRLRLTAQWDPRAAGGETQGSWVGLGAC